MTIKSDTKNSCGVSARIDNAIMAVSGIFLFILILGFCFSGPRCAGLPCTNSDGTAASIQFIHNNQTQEGDTITVPAGTFSWTKKLRSPKQLR